MKGKSCISKNDIYKAGGKQYDSGFMMFPSGHANNKVANLEGILANKF